MTGGKIGGIFEWSIYREGQLIGSGGFPNLCHGPFIANALHYAFRGDIGILTPPTTFHGALWYGVPWREGLDTRLYTYTTSTGTYVARYTNTDVLSLRAWRFQDTATGNGNSAEPDLAPWVALGRPPWNPAAAANGGVAGDPMSWTTPIITLAWGASSLAPASGFFIGGVWLLTQSPTVGQTDANAVLMASGIFSWVQNGTAPYSVLPQLIYVAAQDTLTVEYTLRAT